MFDTVLIANRGEIALRVARTCRELGIRTVAVYSTEDRDSAVVKFADEAVHIGPASSRRSYLYPPAIIEAARRTGAAAIHPGYGFLSEDPDFAEICEANDIVFVGPPAAVLARLADKATVRSIVADAGLAILPGSREAVESAAARKLADETGYPVILKACAGGGGRGMRVVRSCGEFPTAYRETRASAESVFGDGRVYLERFIDGARHIEIQVLCDRNGNAVSLGERDCSVQRRHQKLVEETPAPGVPAELIDRTARAAVRAARAIGYVGLGTFEFLLDEAGRIFFIEMNCRIQVEHPVTEMVTGLDLVREQMRVAHGEPLMLDQHAITRHGVAIECRVNAEDPERGFVPTPGVIDQYVPPGGPFTRVDGHGFTGARVSAHYDPLIAKVVTWGPNREQAIGRMGRALGELLVSGPGICTTTRFLRDVLVHPKFQDGRHTTALVAEMLLDKPASQTATESARR